MNMKRFWKFLAIFLLIAPLTLSAETITWTPSTSWKDVNTGLTGTFPAAEMATMKFYLRGAKVGVTPLAYFGETGGGVSTWTDNVMVKMNSFGAGIVAGDNVQITVSQAFKDTDGVERDGPESTAVRWTIPGAVIPLPTVTLAANPASIISGACSTLTWSTTNATAASIDQGIGAVALSGTKQICPTSTTSRRLPGVTWRSQRA